MNESYSAGLDETLIDPDPIKQFQSWLNDAVAAKLPLPEAMTLATASPDGRPSARMVLLKQVDQDGFVFFHKLPEREGTPARYKSLRESCFLLAATRAPGTCRGQCCENVGGGVA